MTRRPRLTDAQLRAALAPAPDLAAPSGLLAAIAADVARTPQQRRRLRLPAPPGTPIDAWLGHDPRLAWVALAAALLLAAMAGALIAGAMLRGMPERPFAPEIPLVSTGVEVLAPDAGPYDRVMVDGRGTYWAAAPGRLTRFDPGTGARRTWTIADDVAFSGSAVAAARDGGVWINDRTRLLRFTGEGFVDPFGVQPMAVLAFTEQPDRTLWAVDWEDGPMRWDGRAWQPLPAGRPTTRAGILTITNGGDVWVSNLNAWDAVPLGAGVSRLSEGRWTTWDASDARPLGGGIGAIVEAADGSIWVTEDPGGSSSDPGIARFSGGAWSVIDGPGFPAWWLEAAPDDSIWAVTAEVGVPRVARYRDGAWRTYGETDGIAGTELGHISGTPAGVFLGTDAGLFQFVDGRWVAAWPNVVAGPGGMNGPLVPVSADEAWAADGRGVWHFADGRWEGPTQPAPFDGKAIIDLAVGPDGEVWIAGAAGAAVLRDGAWRMALEDDAGTVEWETRTVVVAVDGTAWVGGQSTQIIGLRPSGAGFTRQAVKCPTAAMSMTAAADGSIWLGSHAYGGYPGLARYDGIACTMADVLGAGGTQELTSLATGPDGDIAVEVLLDWTVDQTALAGGFWTRIVARLEDGRWTQIERQEHADGAWGSLTIDPAGRLWRAGAYERFDGERWVPGMTSAAATGPAAFSPDGSLWFQGASGVQRISAARLGLD